jgi:hypothetical protein
LKLGEAGIAGRGSQPFLDLGEGPSDVPSSLGAARLRHAQLNKLFPLAVLGQGAETLGKTVAGVKFQSLFEQGLGGAPVSFQNGLRPLDQRIQKGLQYG